MPITIADENEFTQTCLTAEQAISSPSSRATRSPRRLLSPWSMATP